MYKYEEITEINICAMLYIFDVFENIKKPVTANFLCFSYLKREMCFLF